MTGGIGLRRKINAFDRLIFHNIFFIFYDLLLLKTISPVSRIFLL